MNVAIVHELLTRRGGAESVARIFAEMFPDAPVYTLLYDGVKLGSWFPRARVRFSKIQQLLQPLLQTRNGKLQTLLNHHLYLPFFPRTVEAWDFSGYDLVLSSSSAFVHGIITNGAPRHLCYVHSPARYLWDSAHEVLERAGRGLTGPLKRAYLSTVFHRLRTWDAEAAARPDALLANSREVQRRIELYWRRESTVLHPPIDDFWFADDIGPTRNSKLQTANSPYYLVVSTLTPYKRIDLAIDACNARRAHLRIVGEGPSRAALERRAGPTIEFLGYREREELRGLYEGARAVLFPGTDDFGLVPLEAMACGTPVIAYRRGGVLETVRSGETGEFFDGDTPESLATAMESLEQKKYSIESCRAQAAKFRRADFERALRQQIDAVMHS